MICKWSTLIFCFMIQVVCKQNGPNLEYRHARFKDGYYAIWSVSWEPRQRERSGHEEHRWWMEGGRLGARSLAGAGQVINCEITRPRLPGASSVQTDLWWAETRNKSYSTGNAGNKDVFVVLLSFVLHLFFLKSRKEEFVFKEACYQWWCTGQKFVRTKVVICWDISGGRTRSSLGLIWSFLINTGAGARSPHVRCLMTHSHATLAITRENWKLSNRKEKRKEYSGL